MAEKYGTIPKAFTKEWWEYFWTYYKWYVLIPLFIIIAIVFTAVQKGSMEKFDLTLTYAGNSYYNEEISAKIEENLSKLCPDLDGDGETKLSFVQYNFTNETEDIQYEQALNNKLFLSIAEEQNFILVMDKEYAQRFAGDESASSVFAPLDDWLDADYSGKEIFSANEENYGIALSEIPLFKELGADYEDHYLFIRFYPRKDQLKDFIAGYEAAVRLANEICK